MGQPIVRPVPEPISKPVTQEAQLPDISPESKKKFNRWLFIFLILLLLSIVLIVGYFAYQNKFREKESVKVVGPSTQPQAQPSESTKILPKSTPTSSDKNIIDENYIPKHQVLDSGETVIESIYGYTITIPKGWFVENDFTNNSEFRVEYCKYGGISTKDVSCSEDSAYAIFHLPKDNLDNLEINEWVDSNDTEIEFYGDTIPSRKETMLLGNKKAVVIIPDENISIVKVVYVPLNKKVLAIVFYIAAKESWRNQFDTNIFNQILSTIKFIN